MVPAAEIVVEVVYALAAEQALVRVCVPAGATVQAAIAASGLLQRYPEITQTAQGAQHALRVGVWGKRVPVTAPLAAGDRVEIYRPLLLDPQQARLRRVKKI